MLARVLPYPNRFRLALLGATLGRPFRGIAAKMPKVGNRLAAMLDLAPGTLPTRSAHDRPGRFPAPGPRRGRVALLRGCAQSVLRPDFNEAAIRLLNRHGVEVVQAKGEGCCGALTHHMGQEDSSHALARRTIDAGSPRWTARGGCHRGHGLGLRHHDQGLRLHVPDDPAYADKAARVSAIARDVTEYVTTLGLSEPVVETDLVVAYHSACSMQHGQGLRTEPKALLARAGFT